MAAVREELITYTWKGKNRSGAIVKGELDARTEGLAKSELRRQGIRPTKVKKKPKDLFGSSAKKIITKDISIFSRQLATMLSSGVPLVQALDIVGRGHDNPSMSKLILTVRNDIEGGDTLAQALGKHPLQFDDLFCNLVNAGEQAGVLETLLGKIADYKEKTESLKAKIKKALTYPTAVLVIAFIVTAILLIFVVPTFKELFDGFGAELPAFTLWVIGLSEFMQAWWWAVFGGIFLVIYSLLFFKKRSRKFNHALDRFFLKLPAIGDILNKSAIARFSRTLATMSTAGVPLVEALGSVSGACGNIVYADAVLKMREEVATGQQLQQAMKQAALFPNMVIQMVAIGEESGAVDSMLEKVADFYEEEVDNAVDSLSSLIEPMLMAFLGVVVGGLVVAMYLPIFKLGAVV
jgi:type IV pilus assembly protein PilC